jgi:hypothetical protein
LNAPTRKVAEALVALLALVGFGASLADQAFFHTDDGCQVELHCLACRTASVVVTTDLATGPPTLALAVSDLIVLAPRSQPRSADRVPVAPRGPPTQA